MQGRYFVCGYRQVKHPELLCGIWCDSHEIAVKQAQEWSEKGMPVQIVDAAFLDYFLSLGKQAVAEVNIEGRR